jgi:hypothetical protein
MSDDPEPTPEKPKGRPRPKAEPRPTLAPLDFEEALAALLAVPPPDDQTLSDS